MQLSRQIRICRRRKMWQERKHKLYCLKWHRRKHDLPPISISTENGKDTAGEQRGQLSGAHRATPITAATTHSPCPLNTRLAFTCVRNRKANGHSKAALQADPEVERLTFGLLVSLSSIQDKAPYVHEVHRPALPYKHWSWGINILRLLWQIMRSLMSAQYSNKDLI